MESIFNFFSGVSPAFLFSWVLSGAFAFQQGFVPKFSIFTFVVGLPTRFGRPPLEDSVARNVLHLLSYLLALGVLFVTGALADVEPTFTRWIAVAETVKNMSDRGYKARTDKLDRAR